MNKLKIRSQTMLGTHHSWAVTMRNLLNQFDKMDHELYLKSTNGASFIPQNLKARLNKNISNPDLDICYTMPRNFGSRFRKKSKLRMAIYNYETDKLPSVWLDQIKHLDYVLPSSNFSKYVFVNSGWPEEKCIVVPHGINPEDYEDNSKHRLHTQRSFKFLNVSIPHYRKNIDILMSAYYSAFSSDDDVCLILKTKLELPNRKLYRFEANVKNQIIDAQKKYAYKGAKLPRVEVVQERLPSMVPLYNSCQAIVSAASSEGFGLPLLEGLANGNLIIAPRCTGQLDFLNDENSLLVDVREIDAGSKYQYWVPTKGAKTYRPDIDSLAESMKKAYREYNSIQKKFVEGRNKTIKEFTWENAAKKILEIK